MPWLIALEEGKSVEGEVIAFAKGSPYNIREGFQWSVELSIYVKPECKGKGIARHLYTTLFKLLEIQGYHRLYARIALPNLASQRLHEQFGLTQTGLLPQFAWKFGNWYDVAIYTGLISRTSEPLSSSSVTPQPVLSVIEGWSLLQKQGEIKPSSGQLETHQPTDQTSDSRQDPNHSSPT